MKKLLKAITASVISAVIFISIIACNKTTVSAVPKISIINYAGGVGEIWLKSAAQRFKQLKKDTLYGSEAGVEIEIVSQQGINTASMPTEGYSMYFLEGGTGVRTLAQQGFLLDIDDLVKGTLSDYNESVSIESKIDEDYRIMCKGADGKYYGLPHYEIYSGLTYDIDLFDQNNLYFAASGAANYSSKFGEARFIASKSEQKSCGPDGVTGTYDDGLPSSVVELLILCSKMKGQSIAPFGLSGKYHNYSSLLISSLWASLAGYEQMQSCYSFSGEIEVVTGFKNEPLFAGSNVKAPNTATITVTEKTGYRVYDQSARYYAMALLEIIDDEQWFTETAFQGTSHVEEQKHFVFGGAKLGGREMEKVGMLIDGNWWYNESKEIGTVDEYSAVTGKSDRNVGWMPLPVNLRDTVAERNGKAPTLLDNGMSFAFINGNVKNDEALMRACLDFLQFLYTDAELKAFTSTTGTPKAVNYSLEGQASPGTFQSSLLRMKSGGRVIYGGADNKTFLGGFSTFSLNMDAQVFRVDAYKNYLDPIHNIGRDAQYCFEKTQMTADIWNGRYKGD